MIRGIEAGDAEAVAALARAARFDAVPGMPDLHSPAEDVAFYRSEIATKQGLVWVDDAEAVAGFVIWSGDLVSHLYVDPSAQRRGIGTRLLERAVSDMQVPQVRLWTFQRNERAVAFYAGRGFRVLEATDGSGNEERLPDFLLGRP
jgi:ribosomal protein S18 acetylase RimI-like enzyme